MSPSAYVAEASEWASSLARIERERGHPDPIASVARQTKISRGSVWALIYRPPKRVAADIYFAVGKLYERECARQAERYAVERERAEAKTRIGEALIRAVDPLDCSNSGVVNE